MDILPAEKYPTGISELPRPLYPLNIHVKEAVKGFPSPNVSAEHTFVPLFRLAHEMVSHTFSVRTVVGC